MPNNPFRFDALKRAPLPHQVASLIRERIENGEIKPQTQLPSERKLSETFAVSRVAVREAIQLLQAQSYVEVLHGKGTYVVDPAVRKAYSLDNWLSGRGESLHMMVEMRKIVEPGIAELAAKNVTPERAEELVDLAHQLESGALQEISEIDAEFHRRIAALTGNVLIIELVTTCLMRTEPLRLRTLRDVEHRKLAAQGHIAIAEAIRAGNMVSARQAMEEHLNDAMRSI